MSLKSLKDIINNSEQPKGPKLEEVIRKMEIEPPIEINQIARLKVWFLLADKVE
jgi:hypothetical protein